MAGCDAAGGEWPNRARRAAETLSGGVDETDGAAVQLLADVRDLFAQNGCDRITSEVIVRALAQMEDRQWPEWRHAQPITPRQVAALLKPFGIAPKVVKFPGGLTARGYHLEQFADAWGRYLDPLPPHGSVTCVTSLQNGTFRDVTPQEPVTDEKPSICREVTSVTDKSPLTSADMPLTAPDDPDDEDDDPTIPFVSADLFRRAVAVVMSTGAASLHLVAKRCDCGQDEAVATLAALEAEGVVGPVNGKARDVLIGEGDVEGVVSAYAARCSDERGAGGSDPSPEPDEPKWALADGVEVL